MKICSVEGCNSKVRAKGYCNKHYTQILKHGEIKHGKFDLNEFVLYDTYAEMITYDNHGNEKVRTLIDLEDVEKVKNYKWCESHGYIICNKLKTFLHRLIMNCPSDMVVDHINRNPLDNRKCNLRICTQQQNQTNHGVSSNNTSGTTGVYWSKAKNKWNVRIQVNYKQIHLGYFDTLEEAIEVRKKAEIEYFGEYRNID